MIWAGQDVDVSFGVGQTEAQKCYMTSERVRAV